jgi:hypothetical protein
MAVTKNNGSNGTPVNSIKVTSPEKDFIDEMFAFLSQKYQCKTTSPKMWSDEKNAFYQYFAIEGGAQ